MVDMYRALKATTYGEEEGCRRRLPKKAADKFRGGRGSEVKKKGQK